MRGHRPFTYAILAINTLFLIWLIAGVWTTPSDVPFDCHMAGVAKHWADCRVSPRTVVAIDIVYSWVMVDFILGVVWLFVWSLRRSDRADQQATSL
jgi:hypothetical protein